MKNYWLGAVFIFLSACAGVPPPPVDEDWIIERVLAEDFETLRKVKELSDKGSPVAMYWWGNFLSACVFDRCDLKGAQALWTKAALAGNSKAKVVLMTQVESAEELDRLLEKIGRPSNMEEKFGYATALLAVAQPSGPDTWTPAKTLLKELAAAEPRLIFTYMIGSMEGFNGYTDELRAMAQAGYPPAAEPLRRRLLLTERSGYAELLAKAKAGDLTVAVALCETVHITEGYEKLPSDLLPVCEGALAQGYRGVALALLRHHRIDNNLKAAAFYADLCASLRVRCASELADYHYQISARSPAWELWDAVAALSAGFPETEADAPMSIMRKAFSIRLGNTLAERACAFRRFNAAAKKFDEDPLCPYRQPTQIPDEFLSKSKGKKSR